MHHRPVAVLRPGSVHDVVAMVRFCNDHCLPVAARGQGHSPFGQAQVHDGLVIGTTFGEVRPDLVSAEDRYGPRGILAPGRGIF